MRLEGHQFDLLDLMDQVRLVDISVTKEEDQFYLRSSGFQSCTRAEEVLERANDLVQVLNGAAAIAIDNYHPVGVNAVVEVDDDGERRGFVFLSGTATGRTRATAALAVCGSGGLAPSVPQRSAVETWLDCSRQDDAVNRALSLYGGLAHTWRNLYLVLEVIEDDVGGERRLLALGWVPDSKIKQLKQTANSYRALGKEARHGTLRHPAPARIMTLEEAEQVVRSILRAWLATKCP